MDKFSIVNRFWITKNGKNFLGEGRIQLLRNISDTGSISKAAKRMGMSYKAAWDDVDAMNNLSELPLVKKATGGKEGGGTSLTDTGYDMIGYYERIKALFERFTNESCRHINTNLNLNSNINTYPMKVEQVAVKNACTTMELTGKNNLSMKIHLQNDYYESLIPHVRGLAVHIPPSRVTVSPAGAQLGMENNIRGILKNILIDQELVTLTLSISEHDIMIASMTPEALDHLRLQPGTPALAWFNSDSVSLSSII